MTNSSKVRHCPPALMILALAVSVNLKAAIVIFGTSSILTSSVTVATETTILSLFSPFSWLILEIEIGGLLILEEISLLKIVLVNPELVLLERNLNNYNYQIKTILDYLPILYLKSNTYFDEKMNIKVGASCVPLIRVLNSTSFD
jgi:hypothetical protein